MLNCATFDVAYPGTFTTGIPLSAAAFTSTTLYPVAITAIMRTLGHLSRVSLEIGVLLVITISAFQILSAIRGLSVVEVLS